MYKEMEKSCCDEGRGGPVVTTEENEKKSRALLWPSKQRGSTTVTKGTIRTLLWPLGKDRRFLLQPVVSSVTTGGLTVTTVEC